MHRQHGNPAGLKSVAVHRPGVHPLLGERSDHTVSVESVLYQDRHRLRGIAGVEPTSDMATYGLQLVREGVDQVDGGCWSAACRTVSGAFRLVLKVNVVRALQDGHGVMQVLGGGAVIEGEPLRPA